jgi:hypothetical protein
MDDVNIHIDELVLDADSGVMRNDLLEAIRAQAPTLTDEHLTAVYRQVEGALRRPAEDV